MMTKRTKPTAAAAGPTRKKNIGVGRLKAIVGNKIIREKDGESKGIAIITGGGRESGAVGPSISDADSGMPPSAAANPRRP